MASSSEPQGDEHESRPGLKQGEPDPSFGGPGHPHPEGIGGRGESENAGRDAAARLLQKRYRVYQARREQAGLNLSSSARWNDALKNQRMELAAAEAEAGKNDAASRWQRGGLYAGRLVESGGDESPDGRPVSPHGDMGEGEKGQAQTKASKLPDLHKKMETKYWLEMVDHDHRYASNLKAYHAYWNKHYNGDQNFFYWLDKGDGKDLDLEDCPRSRLDSEKIIYLTAEQRLNYLVKIDSGGKLIWARDGRPVDTSRGRHKDLGDGSGIVDADEEEVREAKDRGEILSDDSSGFSSFSSGSGGNSALEEDAHHYTQGTKPKGIRQRVKALLSPKTAMDRLLRSTLNANTWIWVCDMQFRLYVGLKKSGYFQHSSFLHGSRVIAAGLLKVKDGQLRSLSPLSGHYRSGTAHFKGFVKRLEDANCDMSRVSISKSLATIGALEKYAVVSKKKKTLSAKLKHKLHPSKHPDAVKTLEERENDAFNKKVQGDTAMAMEGKYQCARSEQSEKPKKPAGNGVTLSLPHQDKRKEEMTDEERVERGVALIARAMSRRVKTEAKSDGPLANGLEPVEERGRDILQGV